MKDERITQFNWLCRDEDMGDDDLDLERLQRKKNFQK